MCNKRAKEKGAQREAHGENKQKLSPLAIAADLTYDSAMGKVRGNFS
jgi:hypothetical protein